MTGNTALNIGALFTEVFGISSPIYLPWGRTLQDYDPGKYIGVTTIPDAEAEAYSWMGTPVIGTFTLTVTSNTAPIIRTGHAAR